MTDPTSGVQDLEAAGARLSTAPFEPAPPEGRSFGVVGWARWAWRTLTSMRTALVLLFLLAVASVPGSVFPQRGTNPGAVRQFLADDPVKGPILDRLGMFEVFASPWFAAIYLLLFISLAGCVIPRGVRHWRAMQARPPAAPRHLDRLPEHRQVSYQGPPAAIVEACADYLRASRWRVDATGETVAAEKGYSREVGNLVFHLALLVLLAGVAVGALGGFRGNVVVREGTSFAGSTAQFDSFAPGRLFAQESLPPFSLTLDAFSADFQRGGQQDGAPRLFRADVTLVPRPGEGPQQRRIEVNEPLEVDGVKIFLVGHGYAPTLTVRTTGGDVVFRDSVVCLPQDGGFTSTCVVKVPDISPQLGLTGFFLPTAALDQVRGPYSRFPAPDDPAMFLAAWRGDLGLDAGRPQSVYKLETSGLRRAGIEALRPGQRWTLEDGTTITFDGYVRFAAFAVARDPGKELALAAVAVAMAGLSVSLLVRRRRIWVRASPDGHGRTTIVIAGISRSEHSSVRDELDGVVAALASAGFAAPPERATGNPHDLSHTSGMEPTA